jgi:tetratricopeptide (TPR) repeat protein
MYNLLISIAIAVVTALAFGFGLGGGSFKFVYGIAPALIAGLAAYFVLARRSMKQVQAINERAQVEFQNQNFEKGIDILKEAYDIAKWQFLVESIINAQIGTVLFMTKKFDQAEPFLKKAFKKNWTARAMLAVHYYKKKKYDRMEEAFEEAVQHNKKESLLWNLYAYCQWKRRKRDEAISILNRGLEHIEDDERTRANLEALQNKRKMKMRGWNMMWYQFHLDRPPARQMNAPAHFRYR